jgi:steroid delta-isomerase-like uncharacterized protein
MADKDNVAIARRGFDAWNAHDIEGWLKVLDPNQVTESDTLPAAIRGHDGARPFMQMYIKAFPDLRFTIDQMIGHDQYVVTRYTASGTHKGDLAGIPATGRRAQTRGCTVAEFKNGKIVHQWIYWDTGHLLRQLGVLPGA